MEDERTVAVAVANFACRLRVVWSDSGAPPFGVHRRLTRAEPGITSSACDQDQTPYLDALVAYAERNPGRFHVPGHKGGPGPIPRSVRRSASRPCASTSPPGIEGIDVGPDPARTPFQLAQRLAAEAWGARRSWFLVNGASGGNHAICLALAHRGDCAWSSSATSTPRSSTGWSSPGCEPPFVAPELDPELGIAHCLTPDSLAAALDERARRGRGDDRVAHLLRRRRRRRGAGRGRPRARASRWSSTRPGARTCTSRRRCRPRRSSAAPTWSSPPPTRSSAA